MAKTSSEVSPLHGNTILALKISRNDPRNTGVRTLSHRWHALEFGTTDLVETYVHPKLPGVNVIFLHEAGYASDSIETARARNPHPQQFLLSKLGSNALIASSCMSYHETGHVTVYTHHDSVTIEEGVSLVDFSADELKDRSDPSLVDIHVDRVRTSGGDPLYPLAQADADLAFRLMIAGARENR
jgi:hypothetical protein